MQLLKESAFYVNVNYFLIQVEEPFAQIGQRLLEQGQKALVALLFYPVNRQKNIRISDSRNTLRYPDKPTGCAVVQQVMHERARLCMSSWPAQNARQKVFNEGTSS